MSERALAVAVGTFDGVHLGHRHLMEQVVADARRLGLTPAAVTFSPHPLQVICPDSCPMLLASEAERDQRLKECGAEQVITIPFTKELSQLRAGEFLNMLSEKYGVRHIVVGFNTSMGSDRIHNIADFERIAREAGMTVSRAGCFALGSGATVSSTDIRRALLSGDVTAASQMLGRAYTIDGGIVHGQEIGRKIGFPTANLQPALAGKLIPAPGVYACLADVEGLDQLKAMVNIGTRPTIDAASAAISIEAHLFDCNANLYDRSMTLSFIDRLRDEQRFASVEALAAQLALDKEEAVRILTL